MIFIIKTNIDYMSAVNQKNTIMKKYSLFIFIIMVVVSCHIKQREKTISQNDTAASIVTTVSAKIKIDRHYFWAGDAGQAKGLAMIRNRVIPADSLTLNSILQMLNKMYPEIHLHYTKVSGDTIFIKINNSSYLIRQMGSSGAETYLAEVTFNLTEINGINFNDIQFPEGDHASPGIYSRTDFGQKKN